MKVESKGVEIILSLEESEFLATLLGNISRKNMIEYGVGVDGANFLEELYESLSMFVLK